MEPNQKEKTKVIDFLVSKIVLKDTNIDFTSFTDKKKYNLHLKDINYTIYDFGTFKNSLSSNNLQFKLNENTDVKKLLIHACNILRCRDLLMVKLEV